MTDEEYDELYELAISLRPFSEKHRVKRTQDTMSAVLQLTEIRDLLNMTLKKLESGDVLSEKDADVVLNINVPAVSSLIRPHAVERHWKVRHDLAQKILKKDRHERKVAHSRGKIYISPTKVARARAFLSIFTKTVPGKYWGTEEGPSEAWYEYFKSVYRETPENDEDQ